MVGLIGVGIFLLVVILLLLSKIKTAGTLRISKDEQILLLTVYFYGIRLLRKKIDLSEPPAKEKTFRETLNQFYKLSQNFGQKIRDYSNIATTLLKPVTFRKLSWNTYLGTGEASTAGMAAGGVWAAKGMVSGLLSAKCTFKCNPQMEVTPLFNQRFIQSEFDCIVTIRIGKAIYAFLRVMRKLSTKKQAFI